MKPAETKQGVETGRKLDYGETSDLVGGFFAWKPNRLSAMLVRVLSWVMRPLEQGSYRGRSLSGEPHRASWVIASPLAVFVLPESGYRQKLFLAARLRNTGAINIIQEPPVGGRPRPAKGSAGSKKQKEGKQAKPKRDRGPNKVTGELAKSMLSASSRRVVEDGEFAFDLEALIAVQRESEVALTVVPVVRAFNQMTPDAPATTVATRVYKLNPMQIFRKTTNFARTVRTARVKNCRPLVLSRWLEANPKDDLCSQAAALRVELMGNIESERRALTGPPISPKWEVKRRVLADPALAAYMQEYALEEGITREAVLARARDYLDEIASDYRVGVVRYFCRVVDYFFDRFLDDLEVDREGIRFLSECDSRSRIVLVCAHKSYVDPLMIGYTLFRSGMVPPQQASGLNLNFWPVGWLLRHSGAFYLRRTFAGETLYRETFSAYVRYLLAENYTSVLYIEGTRSRDGKLQRPKTGYLRILAECMNAGVCQDITLVPVYLGYDKVPEEPAHVREMAGGRKVSESIKGFARIYKSFNTRLGRAYVKFGTPMSFKGLLREHGLEGTAQIASDGINRITPVTARSLAACAMLAPGTDWVSEEEFEKETSDLLQFCARRSLPMAVNADPEGVRGAVDWFALEGHVTPESREDVPGFSVAGNGRRFLEYNKNIPLGHFLEPALSAVAWRASAPGQDGQDGEDERRTEAVGFLKSLFEFEFVFSPSRADEAWKLDHQAYADVLRSLLESYLESYAVVCAALGSLDPDSPMATDKVVEMCFSTGERMLKEGVIRRVESVNRVAFRNALKSYRKMGLVAEIRAAGEDDRKATSLVPGERFEELQAIEQGILSFL